MKVKVKEPKKAKEKDVVYPSLWIGKRSNAIVLFHSEEQGIVLDSANASNLTDGEYVDSFGMCHFTPFKGELILSND